MCSVLKKTVVLALEEDEEHDEGEEEDVEEEVRAAIESPKSLKRKCNQREGKFNRQCNVTYVRMVSYARCRPHLLIRGHKG